ncbi:MAG: Flp pilus assembly complex ATPase component TadA [Cyanobacteria bacterium RUI128]|nr:Flp pilus assembly complex ATPase component TadA [Cyanobacteria bacterium RUI128]
MAIEFETVDEIEQKIDYANLRKFKYDELIGMGFIPVCIDGDMYQIVSLSKDNESEIRQLMEQRTTHGAGYEFTIIKDKEFKDLIGIIDEHFASDKQMTEIVSKGYNIGLDEVYDDAGSDTQDDYKVVNKGNYTVSVPVSAEEEAIKHHVPTDASKKKVGELLIEMGLITEEQLFDALVTSKKTGNPIGSVLIQKEYIALETLKNVLAAQRGMEAVSSSQLKLDSKILSVLPDDFVKLNMVLPIQYDGKNLIVGMVNPGNKQVINDIVYLTGLKPRVMLITHYEFLQCIKQYYSESKKETNQYIKKIEQELVQYGQQESLWDQAEKALEQDDSVIVKFVNKLITDGIKMRASDIHLEPRLTRYVVRYRIDGVLREVLDIPSQIEGSVLTRLKVISKMNIAEHRRPQDGTFSIKFQEKSYDFRINTIPVGSKEKMVIRILATAESLGSVDKTIKLIGATDDDLARISRIKSSPNGIILAAGPTGSGKTTTLYSIVRNLNDESVNIMTIEDPIEIRIEGINQTQVNPKAGITFASCLRAALRQDPDIILVGEIRDVETVEIAIAAALTGHLVLSTIHTNSAAATVTRLIEMGAKDYLISSTLVGVIAQRLVRRLCDKCKVECHPTEEEARMVMVNNDDVKRFMQMTIYKPGKCDECNKEGYKGRLGLYEVMHITKEIKKLIAIGAHDIQIEEAAVGAGMRTLQQSCLHHIISGKTTIEEFVRVLGPVNE